MSWTITFAVIALRVITAIAVGSALASIRDNHNRDALMALICAGLLVAMVDIVLKLAK